MELLKSLCCDSPDARNVLLLRFHTACANSVFVAPVMVLYFRDAIGLNFEQLMICDSVMSATVVLMALPAGWLADVTTRVAVLFAAAVSGLSGWLTLWLAHGLGQAILAYGLLGLSLSLGSGSTSALLCESLREKADYARQEGMRQAFGGYALALASAMGGLLYHQNRDLPLAATCIGAVLAILAVAFMDDAPRSENGPVRARGDVRHALKTVREDRMLADTVLLSSVLLAITRMMFRTQQPYFVQLGIPVAYFGLLSATGGLMSGAGSQTSHVWRRWASPRTVTAICFAMSSLICLLCGSRPGYATLPLLLAGPFIWGLGLPQVQSLVGVAAPDHCRAMMLSLVSLIIQLISIPLVMVVGWVTSRYGVRASLLALSGMAAAGAVRMLPTRR